MKDKPNAHAEKKEKTPLTPQERKRRIMGIVVIVLILLLMALLTVAVGRPLIKHLDDPEAFRDWIGGQGFKGKLAFIGIVAVQVVLAFIPGEPLEAFAGYAFGTWQGLGLCLIGMALGTALICLIVKRLGMKIIETFFSIEKIKSLDFLKNAGRLNRLVFILFLIPGTPKDLMTYCVWLTPMKLSTFLLISSVARIPSVITSTLSGDLLGTQNYWTAIIIYGATAVVSLGGMWLYQRITKRNEEKRGSPGGESS